MTLEEAIAHLREMLSDESHEWNCEECRQEHEQLLKWLEELRELRKTDMKADAKRKQRGVTFEYVSGEYWSNCCIEAVKARLKDWHHVKIYFCKPSRSRMFHFMWTDGSADFDFSDSGVNGDLPWYKCLLFRGQVRKFKLGFAADYAAYRNGKGN